MVSNSLIVLETLFKFNTMPTLKVSHKHNPFKKSKVFKPLSERFVKLGKPKVLLNAEPKISLPEFRFTTDRHTKFVISEDVPSFSNDKFSNTVAGIMRLLKTMMNKNLIKETALNYFTIYQNEPYDDDRSNGVWYVDDFKAYRTYQIQLGGYRVFDFVTGKVSEEVTKTVQVYNVPFTLDKFRLLLQSCKLPKYKFMKLLETGEIPVDTGEKVVKLFATEDV